jgi:hypothetical protein
LSASDDIANRSYTFVKQDEGKIVDLPPVSFWGTPLPSG